MMGPPRAPLTNAEATPQLFSDENLRLVAFLLCVLESA